MTEQLKHIIAETKKTGNKVDLYFYSIKQAIYFNPGLNKFKIAR